MQAAGVALIVSIFFAWLITRWIVGPLQTTAAAARAVASGDYDQRITPSGPEETRSLAASFNEMVQQVRTSQKAMRDFVANVSHELKTPLTSIMGFAQALLDRTASDPESQERAARVIYDESNRLRRLVEGLLDLARLDSGQMSFERGPVDLNALLSTVIEKLSFKAQEKEVAVETSFADLPVVIGDGDRLAQVFTNLIDNGLNHTPREGKIRVATKLDEEWVVIDVEDSGAGIPEEELSRIFERFYRLDKARTGGSEHGTGLGLAISREIIHAHAGLISARSIPGIGSRFTIRLPIVLPHDETLARTKR
jgi:signal transduction histidine kinase